jgi:hypothetical protein
LDIFDVLTLIGRPASSKPRAVLTVDWGRELGRRGVARLLFNDDLSAGTGLGWLMDRLALARSVGFELVCAMIAGS